MKNAGVLHFRMQATTGRRSCGSGATTRRPPRAGGSEGDSQRPKGPGARGGSDQARQQHGHMLATPAAAGRTRKNDVGLLIVFLSDRASGTGVVLKCFWYEQALSTRSTLWASFADIPVVGTARTRPRSATATVVPWLRCRHRGNEPAAYLVAVRAGAATSTQARRSRTTPQPGRCPAVRSGEDWGALPATRVGAQRRRAGSPTPRRISSVSARVKARTVRRRWSSPAEDRRPRSGARPAGPTTRTRGPTRTELKTLVRNRERRRPSRVVLGRDVRRAEVARFELARGLKPSTRLAGGRHRPD